MARRPWQLFIDESGDFDDPTDVHVVAGLLVPAAAHPSQAAALRELLRRGLPGIPYPPHASHLNLAVGRMAATLLATGVDEAPRDIAECCHAAKEALLAAPRGVAGVVREALATRRMPTFGALRSCEQWLAINRSDLHDDLRVLQARDREAMRDILARTRDAFKAPSAMVVAAVGHGADGAGYLALLEVLFERTLMLLRARDAQVEVRATVATRHVPMPEVARKRTPLMPAAIGQAIHAAMSFPFLPATGLGDPRVARIVAESPPRYEALVHPGVVLADFIANRARSAFRALDRPWVERSAHAASLLALPVDVIAQGFKAAGPLPTVAADGIARARVRAQFEGAPVPDGRSRGWRDEQAERWIAAAPPREAGP
jgi:hypothetical protein